MQATLYAGAATTKFLADRLWPISAVATGLGATAVWIAVLGYEIVSLVQLAL